MLASFHWDNFIASGPKRGPNGTLAPTLPIGKAKIAGIAASDIGAAAHGMFKKGREPDVFRSFGFPAADDLGNMFQFNRDFEAV